MNLPVSFVQEAGGPQSRSTGCGEDKILVHIGIRIPTPSVAYKMKRDFHSRTQTSTFRWLFMEQVISGFFKNLLVTFEEILVTSCQTLRKFVLQRHVYISFLTFL
jgi:hypothetical protein